MERNNISERPVPPEHRHQQNGDDDEEEVAAAEAAGIKANLVPSALEEGAIAKWWANKLHEAGLEIAPRMKKYLKDHPYMEPDGLQETN